MNFQESLEKRFKFTGRASRDNLPALAINRQNWGPSGDHGRRSLARMLGDMRFREAVEIGTHRGESAKLWLEHSPKLHLTCIDPYRAYNARHSQRQQDNVYFEAKEKLKTYRADILREDSLDVVDSFEDKSLDFVYIDGNHEFDPVMQDLIRWAPKVKRGGIIALHDYCVFWWGGVITAINAYTAAHHIDPWYVTRDYMPTAFWEKRAERAR